MSVTLNELVYSFKNLLGGGLTNTESVVSDRMVAFWYNTERSKLLKEEFEKNKLLSPAWVQDLGCVPIECVDKVECCNLPFYSGETIHKTTINIPKPVTINWSGIHSNILITYVGLVTHDSPFEFTSEQSAHWSKYNRFTAHLPRAFYRNQRIYITNIKNPSHLEVINIKGIFENPDEVSGFNTCTNEPCFTFDSPYPIPSHIVSPLKQIIETRYLEILLNTNVDYVNNANMANKTE